MLKKIKAFYKKNRVYSILMFISIVCIMAIVIGVISYFLGQTTKNKYGNRLDGIKQIEIKDSRVGEIENKINENEKVKKTEVDIKGKLIYVIITLSDGNTHADAEAIAQASLDLFSEKERAFYDIDYIVDCKTEESIETFPIMGYIKAGNTVIKWTKYSV